VIKASVIQTMIILATYRPLHELGIVFIFHLQTFVIALNKLQMSKSKCLNARSAPVSDSELSSAIAQASNGRRGTRQYGQLPF
jgi:uncharacterized membrane protein YoaT (DUF817 family)